MYPPPTPFAGPRSQPRQPPVSSLSLGARNAVKNLAFTSADALPFVLIGSSYVAEPRTPLHAVDARVKEAWVVALLLLVARASGRTGIAIAAGAQLRSSIRPLPVGSMLACAPGTLQCAAVTGRVWQEVSND